jgi:hypothetical protein
MATDALRSGRAVARGGVRAVHCTPQRARLQRSVRRRGVRTRHHAADVLRGRGRVPVAQHGASHLAERPGGPAAAVHIQCRPPTPGVVRRDELPLNQRLLLLGVDAGYRVYLRYRHPFLCHARCRSALPEPGDNRRRLLLPRHGLLQAALRAVLPGDVYGLHRACAYSRLRGRARASVPRHTRDWRG